MKKALIITLMILWAGPGLAFAQSTQELPVPFGTGPESPERVVFIQDPAGERFWFTSEYVLWWIKKGSLPLPIATTGDPNANVPGAIGERSTAVLVGNSNLDYQAFSGLRLSAGVWLDPEQTWGIDAGGFLLARRATRQTVSSDANGNPGIFRPLNDIIFGEDSFTVSFPGSVAGTLSVSSASRLWGAEANLILNWDRSDRWEVTLLAGFRHVNLDETIDISRFSNDFGGLLCSPSDPGNTEPAGSLLTTTDSFHARNQFYGGQIGMRAVFSGQRGLFLDMRGKLALGGTHQTLDIAGNTTQTLPGLTPVSFPGGVLATGSNSGHFSHDAFSVIPEVEVRLGYQLTALTRLHVGYNFLYWSNVIRPGDQISRSVDERSTPTGCSFVPGFQATVPGSPSFHQSGFWAQGLTFGLQFTY